MRGVFITFEGGEGAGKTTQISLLDGYLQSKGISVACARDPGTTKLAEKVRGILKEVDGVEISIKTETLLYLAARAQLVDEYILPKLDAGEVVLCDRFADSTMAYQGFGGELNLANLDQLCTMAASGLMPDLTFYLKLSPEDGLKRKSAQGLLDRMEQKGLNYHKKVHDGYDYLAQNDRSGRIVTIDAAQTAEKIHSIIKTNVDKLLNI